MTADRPDPVAVAFRTSYARIVDRAPLLDDDVETVAARAPEPRRSGRRPPAWHAVAAAAVVLVAVGAAALWAAPQRGVLVDPGAGFEPDIVAFLGEGADHAPIRAVLESSPHVTEWRLFTEADAYREAQEVFADDPQLLAIIERDPSVLPESYRLRSDPEWWPELIAELEATPGVLRVMTNDERERDLEGG